MSDRIALRSEDESAVRFRRSAGRVGPGLLLSVLAAAAFGSVAQPASALTTPPSSPQNVVATADDEAAYVTWSPPSSNGGARIDGYKVVETGSTATVVAPCTQCTTVYFSGLTNGTSYSFSVYAHNSSGYSLLPGLSGSVVPQAPLEPAPSGVQSASASATGLAATVSWTPPSSSGGATIDRYLVQAFNDTLSAQGAQYPYFAGSVYACGTCASVTFPALSAGQTYHFVIYAHNKYSYGPGVLTSSVVGSDPSCASGKICVGVDGTSDDGPIAWRADGFLHGIGFTTPTTINGDGATVFSYNGPSPSLVAALRPQQWRSDACTFAGGSGDPDQPECQWIGANTSAAISDVLSDSYRSITYNDYAPFGYGTSAGAVPPWDCWSCYSQEVASIVGLTATNHDLPAYLGNPIAPSYWDVQNEPPSLGEGGYYGSDEDGSTSLYLQQFEAAYKAIETTSPNAQVIGPSLSDFTDTSIECDGANDDCAPGYGTYDPHILGLDSFLPFAAKNDMILAAISWHDNSPYFDDTPVVASQQMSQYESLLSEYGMSPIPAFINEYGAQDTNLVPGWSAGWIASLESSKVGQANRSCWTEMDQQGNTYNECGAGPACPSSSSTTSPGTLDGLFTSPCLGTSAEQPDGNYWVYDYYAGMSGDVINTSTSDQTLTALATKTTASQQVQILLGRHETCTPAQNAADCSTSSGEDLALLPTPSPANVVVSVNYPFAASSVQVSIDQIPDSSAAVPQPTPTVERLPVVNGTVSVPISGFADGEAYTVTVVPTS